MVVMFTWYTSRFFLFLKELEGFGALRQHLVQPVERAGTNQEREELQGKDTVQRVDTVHA